jgi:hypothetical protein
VREQSEQNARTAEAFARSASKQQESFGALTRQWVGAYRDFFSPFAYFREGVRITQQANQQALEATERAAGQGLRLAHEAAEQTEQATREAELKTAVSGALGTANYDELTVDEISKRLGGLSSEDLRKVREYEKRNKNRETLIEQTDRKIRANS